MPNLNSFLDPELQATHADQYVAHVLRLLNDGSYYRRASNRAIEISRAQADTKPFAETLHSALQKVLGRGAGVRGEGSGWMAGHEGLIDFPEPQAAKQLTTP